MEPPSEYPWLKELNEPQRQAVTHGAGPLLVVAGAGSGKTRTLASRVALLVGQGVPPEKILLLTFTRRASREMLNRAATALGPETGRGVLAKVWGGTFHAVANRLLRIYYRAASLSPDFTIMDQADAEDMLHVIRTDLGLAKKDKRFPRKRTCLAIYSRRMNGAESLDAVLKKQFPWCEMWQKELGVLFKAYVERKQRHKVLDYDDLLIYWYYLLENKDVAESIESRFEHVLVDEYQDTNKIQAGILERMRQKNRTIMVVGDDAQSIYSFRSATVRNMLDFPSQFVDTRLITLDCNYRSVETILTTTNRIIEQANERFSKELWSVRKGGQRPALITCRDEEDEAKQVADRVLEHYEQGVALRKQAVLFRASWHSNTIEVELARRNIPFHKYGGLKFLEAAHIKDLISILRIQENPADAMAWFRILGLISGIGPATASAIVAFLAENGNNPVRVAGFKGPPPARGHLMALGQVMADLGKLGSRDPGVQVERTRRFYEPLLKENYDNAEARVRDLANLEQIAGQYRSRKQFLTDLVLDPPSSTGDFAGPPSIDEDCLILSTIHSAKGAEWDSVYLIHASDGCLPSDMATGSREELDEELRLTYVAMTRARDFLYVLWPQRFYTRPAGFSDRHSYAQCSRFFTDHVCETMDILGGGEQEEAADTTSDADQGKSSVIDRLKGMWD